MSRQEAWQVTPFVIKRAFKKCIDTKFLQDTIILEQRELIDLQEEQILTQDEISRSLISNTKNLSDSLDYLENTVLPDKVKKSRRRGWLEGFSFAGTVTGVGTATVRIIRWIKLK